MTSLRSKTIRRAAAMPEGSPEREALLKVLAASGALARLEAAVAAVATELGRDFRVFVQVSRSGGTIKILEGRRDVGNISAMSVHLTNREKDDFAMEQAGAGIPRPTRRRRRAAAYGRSECLGDFAALREQRSSVEDLWFVGHVILEPVLRGRGLGKLLYAELIAQAARHKAAVGPGGCDDEPTSGDAFRVWKSLVRQFPHVGYVVWGG